MRSSKDPLFASKYFELPPAVGSYLVDEDGCSVFDNPCLPDDSDFTSSQSIKEFLNNSAGSTFIYYKNILLHELSDWAKTHDLLATDQTFDHFNSYFNSESHIGFNVKSLYRQGVPYLEAYNRAIQ